MMKDNLTARGGEAEAHATEEAALGEAAKEVPAQATSASPAAAGGRSVRIAQVAPLVLPVPPVRYGGTERVIFALTEELVRLGHDVTLFAAGTSRTSARLIACSPRPLWELDPAESVPYPHGQLDRVSRQLRQFDIVHTHTDQLLCLARDTMATPLVATLMAAWLCQRPRRD